MGSLSKDCHKEYWGLVGRQDMQRAGQLSVCIGKKDQRARLPVVSGQWPQSREVCEVGRQEDICRRGFECTGERLLSRPGCQENMQECTGERPVLGQAGSGTTAEATTAISCNSGQQQHQCQSPPKNVHSWTYGGFLKIGVFTFERKQAQN